MASVVEGRTNDIIYIEQGPSAITTGGRPSWCELLACWPCPDPLAELLDGDLRAVAGTEVLVVLVIELLEEDAQAVDAVEERFLRLVQSLGVPVQSSGQMGDRDECLVLVGVLGLQHVDEHSGLFDLHVHRLAQRQTVLLGLLLGLLEAAFPELLDARYHPWLEPAHWHDVFLSCY